MVRADGSPGTRFWRLEWISLAIAIAWGTGLVVAAIVAPVYRSSSDSSQGTVTNGSGTLVGVNGWHALLIACAPLAAAVLTGCALWRRARRHGAGVFAWAICGLLVCLNIVAMLSIGVFVIPVTVALAVACGTHGPQPPGAVPGPGIAG